MQDVSFTPLTQYIEMSPRQHSPDISSQSNPKLPRLESPELDTCRISETETLQWDAVSLAAIDFRTPEMGSDLGGTLSWPRMNRTPPVDSRLTAEAVRNTFEMKSPTPIFGDNEASPTPTCQSTRAASIESRRMKFDTASPLEATLRDVIEFISAKECTMAHSNSINLKRNVGKLLELVHTMVVQNNNDVSVSRYGGNHSLDEGFMLTKSLIATAPTATLNTYKPVEVSQGLIPTRVCWKRRWKTIRLGSTTLTMLEKTTGRFSDQSNHDDEMPTTDWHFGTKLTFRPKNSAHMLQIEVQQYQLSFLGLTMPSRLIVNNIRPDDSLVFKIAENGSVDDLLYLFSTGQASLRDCDERGASLLYHGLWNLPICKLLVEEGLDVDEMVLTKEGSYSTLLHVAMVWRSRGRDSDSRDPGRVLLSAGADPTTEPAPGRSSVIDWLTSGGIRRERCYSRIQHIFDLASYYESSSFLCGSVIHNLCADGLRGASKWGILRAAEPDLLIELALKRGCQPNLKANIGSPLHARFRECLPPPSEVNWLKALIRLVQNGTDIFAVDKWGVTVSDIAYAELVCYEFDNEDSLGSYRGDLFDALLSACHYSIADFRRNRPRIARYTEWYCRQDFEKLWEGREQLCPYWNDEVWPALPQPADVGYFEDGRTTILCVCEINRPTQWIGVDDPPTGCINENLWNSDDSDGALDSDAQSAYGLDDDDEIEEEDSN
ncbi:hypothetical protein F5Y18DRAFT_270352 [Xylariaceae sp. FL1019]|nr:hypothetical protein F5Y18DRAFT_270352 [Xylariaceae sp. FL1019]